MKTEAQLARTEMELNAIDAARSTLRYLGYGPATTYRPYGDTWQKHLQALDDELGEALTRGEFWINNPNYKFG